MCWIYEFLNAVEIQIIKFLFVRDFQLCFTKTGVTKDRKFGSIGIAAIKRIRCVYSLVIFVFCSVYYDPFLAAHAATQDPNYRLQVSYSSILPTFAVDHLPLPVYPRPRRAVDLDRVEDAKEISSELLIKSTSAPATVTA